jgi:hypothetical protein
MASFVAYAAAICAAVSAWLVRGALALESSAPGAPKLGLLSPWFELVLFVLAAVCVVFLLRPSSDSMLPLFATAACMLPWVDGIRVPARLMWTGPLGVALWAGAVTASVFAGRHALRPLLHRLNGAAVRDPKYAPFISTAGACAFFAIVAFGARGIGPISDQPHYLILAQSLLYDRDLQIENNHARGDYQEYYPGSLRPDFVRRGQNGAIYSIHSPGLPALVAPAFLVGGYRGVIVLLVLVAALGAGLLWRLAYAVSGRASAAWFAVAATAGATPVAFHASTVFPDGPAGVIALTGIWGLFRLANVSPDIPCGSVGTWGLHGVALALLPWMHTRFAALAGPLAVVILLRMPRSRQGVVRAGAFLAAPAVSALAWFGYFYVIYGTPNPAAPWSPPGSSRLIAGGSWRFIPGGLSGILFDQQFGAVLYAPIVIVGVAGWLVMLANRRRLALEMAAIAVPYMLVTTQLWIWWGGWSVPARLWTPLIWLGGVPAAMSWATARTRAARGTAIGLLLVSGLTTGGLAYVSGGAFAYSMRDGYAQWFAWLSPMTDLPLGLPSFFRLVEHQSMYRLQILVVVVVFVTAFMTLRWLGARVRGNGAFALLLLTTYAVAAMIVVTILWRANNSAGIRVSDAQLRLLHAARDDYRVGVKYGGGSVRFSRPDDVLQDLKIESPPRLTAGREAPALVLPGWIPAGRYNVAADVDAAAASSYEVRVVNAGPAILQASLSAAAAPRLGLSLTLPVDTPALILRGRGLHSGELRPEHVATYRERFSVERATAARRYGSTIAWFVDQYAFDDPDGLWTAGGGAEARVLLQPDAGSSVRVLVRNGPEANEVALRSEEGDWQTSLAMNPGQEQEIEVPLDPARGAVLVRVISRSGFRPSEIEAGSRDTRLLGVWMLPR